MKNLEEAKKWLKRAKSNLARARIGKASPEMFYEDSCFDAQQAAEKALKSLCIAHGIVFPKTHSIDYLIELLERGGVPIPDEVTGARMLTLYAVETRYPTDYELVDESEYLEAVRMAEKVLDWVDREIED